MCSSDLATIAQSLGLVRATVVRRLGRHGLRRLPALDPPPPTRRYQRERPGEMIHIEIKKLVHFDLLGHRLTGTHRGCRNRGAGRDFGRASTASPPRALDFSGFFTIMGW